MNVDYPDNGHVEIQAVESVAGQWPNIVTFYGNANIVNGVLAFGMTKIRCDGRLFCQITLFDDRNNEMSPSGDVSWAAPDARYQRPEIQYLQFSNFPPCADGEEMTSCAYRVGLTYQVPENEETNGWIHRVPDHEPSDPGMEISLIVYRG